VRLILASASPRRAELLRAAGFDFDVVVTDIDESIRSGERPSDYVRRLAAGKSAAAAALAAGNRAVARENSRIILGADTTVVLNDEIFGKPRDDAEVAGMLRKLSGKRHQVLTAISLREGTHELGRVETTEVDFDELSDDDIAWYVASGEGRDKAGAYAIQGRAARFIPRIAGSYSNVVGLPIAALAKMLRSLIASQR
jgi:septum formation protein